jgi:alpha-galactosidase
MKIKLLICSKARYWSRYVLLDDGWFGNKYPRNDEISRSWRLEENAKKLPHGLGYLV